MPTATLRNLGGSVIVAVPKKILSLVDLRAGSQVQISVRQGCVVVKPKKRPQYTLSELLANTRKTHLFNPRRDRDWLSGGPAGKEAL
jgi:antitoxin ChpS